MVRKGFKMKLYPDMAEEYEKRHNELWPEMTAQHLHQFGFLLGLVELPAAAFREVALDDVRTEVRGGDDDGVSEVHHAALAICQAAIVEHLKQDVVDIGMRLFDFIEQEHAMRVLVHAIRQKPALIEADIARRRADQAADRVALHVLRHVEADQLDAHDVG